MDIIEKLLDSPDTEIESIEVNEESDVMDKNPFFDQDYFNLRNRCPILKGL
jgi:hypothetical protein